MTASKMSVGVIYVVLFVASVYATPVMVHPTRGSSLSDKIDKVLSDTERGFGLISSILGSLGRGLTAVNGKLSRVLLDVRRLDKERSQVDDSIGRVIRNHTMLKSVLNTLERLRPRCPNTWVNRGQRCYKFNKCKKECSANDVRGFCENQGATLASLKSAQLNEFVSSLVTDNLSHYFAGARDDLVEGEWLWPDGSRAVYTKWDGSEPNNSGGNEHCLMVRRHRKNAWNDRGCDTKVAINMAGYVCEKEIWS